MKGQILSMEYFNLTVLVSNMQETLDARNQAQKTRCNLALLR